MDTLEEKHDHLPLQFPDDFLWGTASAAHQVEGLNIHSDWWDWELKYQAPFRRSGVAADFYHRYKEDFQIAQDLNLNSQRISIEWARIEPREGEFDREEIAHYKQMLFELKERGFTTMVTLWHFTLPLWIAKKGGWENSRTIEYFVRFIKEVVPEFKEYVDIWVTLNEPGVYVYMSYLVGEWPPQKKSRFDSMKVFWNLTQAHISAYKTLKQITPSKAVGIANNIQSFEPYHKHSVVEQIRVVVADLIDNHSFYFLTKGCHDFLGVNYYFHHRFRDKSKGIIPDIAKETQLDMTHDVSDLGWEVYPEGIYQVLADISDHVPIYITECGIASTNDDRRTRFLVQYLQEIYRAIKSGIQVKGFFYWSLIDNFEWHRGFEPRFGLVEVNYKTQERKPRPSAYVYAEIAKRNNIPHELLRLLGHTVRVQEVLCYKHDGPRALCEHNVS